jgi:hypothetical protein
MSKRTFTAVEIEALKREAKKLRKREGIQHVAALDRIAVREGFESWWHLQHLSSLQTRPSSRDTERPVVRFVMNPKDVDDMDDASFEPRGFKREWEYPAKIDEGWDSAEIAVFRFTEWPGEDLGVALKRIEETFFFPPDEIWVGDKKVPDRDWTSKNPSWAIMRDVGESTHSPAMAIVEELLPDLGELLVNDDEGVTGAIAVTNAFAFGFDDGEVESADFVNGESEISFTASLTLTGNQDPEKPWNGDSLHVVVSGLAIRAGASWTFDATEVERIESNAGGYD